MKKLILSLLLLCPTIYFGQIVEMVTGGTPVSVNEIPYQIALFQNGTFRCGGSILNEKWILTAAHCFDYPSNPNIVKVGISTLNQNNQTFEIKQKVIHPNYSIYNKDNDIALVEIKGNILYGTSVQPINLVSVNENLYNINTTTTVSGWGWLYPNSEASSNHLQKVEVPIISNTEASNRLDISFPMHPRVTQNMIATGAVSNHRKGACHGDSGGALTTIDANGQVKQIGVVSWGVPKCTGNENSPTIYTKVANYIDWIRQYVPLHIKIEGSSVICNNTTQTYTLENTDNTPIQWQLSSDIEEISRAANSITIKPKSGFNGLATLKASNGNSDTTKTIWVGKPHFNIDFTSEQNYVHIHLQGNNLQHQGISNVKWEGISQPRTRNRCEGTLSGNGFTGRAHGNCFNWVVNAKVTATNICGTCVREQTITPNAVEPCDYTIRNNGSGYQTYHILPCDNNPRGFSTRSVNDTGITIQISNAMGQIVLTTKNKEFSLSHLLSGTYYAKVIKNGQVVHTQTLLKQ